MPLLKTSNTGSTVFDESKPIEWRAGVILHGKRKMMKAVAAHVESRNVEGPGMALSEGVSGEPASIENA